MFRPLPLALCLPIALTACTGDETVARYGGADKTWTLAEINGAPANLTATLRFAERGRLAGRTPCNSYAADMTAPYPWFEAQALSTTPLTPQPCPHQRAEQRYLSTLTQMTQSEVLDTTLILTGNGAELVFTAAD